MKYEEKLSLSEQYQKEVEAQYDIAKAAILKIESIHSKAIKEGIDIDIDHISSLDLEVSSSWQSSAWC